MDKELLVASLATIGTLTATSIYGLVATAIRKRVTVRSPEAQATEEEYLSRKAIYELQVMADGGTTYLVAGMLYP